MKNFKKSDMFKFYISFTKQLNNLEKDMDALNKLVGDNWRSVFEVKNTSPRFITWEILSDFKALKRKLELAINNQLEEDEYDSERK